MHPDRSHDFRDPTRVASWLPCSGDSVQISWLNHPGYRKCPSYLASELLSADVVDALLTGGSLRHPEVLVVRDGRPVDAKEFTTTRVVSDVEFPDVVRVDRALEFLKEGCTLILNLEKNVVRYFIRKRVDSTTRLTAQMNFTDQLHFDSADSLHANYFGREGQSDEPFAMLHQH